ncbi:Hypp7129 [Branchiostoma lanceolatum]|uniref:Hypp7129 protein n=1 Tax=Branchiostoma lanceolatum TaxID=7740 RepID=A0A8K0E9F6_BRALA|nr:Hypp7129 [Branchiostoma lanceolatum]
MSAGVGVTRRRPRLGCLLVTVAAVTVLSSTFVALHWLISEHLSTEGQGRVQTADSVGPAGAKMEHDLHATGPLLDRRILRHRKWRKTGRERAPIDDEDYKMYVDAEDE